MEGFELQLRLPAPWRVERDDYIDESGAEITHVEAHRYNAGLKRDEAVVDVYVGEMPEDTTAEDQALSNYADIVGFDDDDPEDFNPVSVLKFNGRNAYVFEALCEDDSPMMFISQEIRQGILAIVCVAALDDAALADTVKLVECNLRLRKDSRTGSE